MKHTFFKSSFPIVHGNYLFLFVKCTTPLQNYGEDNQTQTTTTFHFEKIFFSYLPSLFKEGVASQNGKGQCI